MTPAAPSPPPPGVPPRGALSSRLLVAFLLPALLFFALMGYVAYALARAAVEEELGRSLARVAAAAASQVSPERLLAVEPGDDARGTRTWRALSRLLEEVREASGARRVLLVDKLGHVRADAGGGLPVGAEAAELARDRQELRRVLEGELAASAVLFEGTDGQLYKTGYAPVRTRTGEVVGVVAVEGSGAFYAALGRLARASALVGAAALAVLALVAVLTARGIAQPLHRLVEGALRIGRGDLATPVPAEPTREIGILARELEAMRAALQGRDRQLQMMLAGVAHEVRNPLGGISLFAGLLGEDLEAGAGADARAHLARIRVEVAYLQRIVEDFLAFAREQPLQRVPLPAATLLEAAASHLEGEAHARHIALEVRAEEAVLEGDEGLLTAALVNLVKNAVQATPDGGRVAVEGVRTPDGYAVRVSDTGHGIPADVRAHIWEPFFTTREQGSGLGLPLARKVARAHGGDLTLLDAHDATTTFELTLPRAP